MENEKDFIEEISRLESELKREKEQREMYQKWYSSEADRFKKYREAIRSVVLYIDE